MQEHRAHWSWNVPLVLLSLTMMAPLAFMLTTALASADKAMQATDSVAAMVIPHEWKWGNFLEVWRNVPFLRYYANSLFIALIVTFGQVFTSACAAYAFARLQWPGRDRVFLAYLATMMVPGAVTMIPNFIMIKSLPEWLGTLFPFIDWVSFRWLGLRANAPMVGRLAGLDSYFTLIVPSMFSAYGTFMLRQFLLTIPRELEEAARIDGGGYWRIFTSIILPLSKPGLVTLTIFTFMGTWGSFLWPLITTNQDQLRTLPLGLQSFQGQFSTEWQLLMAAALLILLPNVVIFLLGQRYFMSGLTVGAVKG